MRAYLRTCLHTSYAHLFTYAQCTYIHVHMHSYTYKHTYLMQSDHVLILNLLDAEVQAGS